jgi:hypothetical protein
MIFLFNLGWHIISQPSPNHLPSNHRPSKPFSPKASALTQDLPQEFPAGNEKHCCTLLKTSILLEHPTFSITSETKLLEQCLQQPISLQKNLPSSWSRFD